VFLIDEGACDVVNNILFGKLLAMFSQIVKPAARCVMHG